MPTKGEIPLTSYFPRISSRQTPAKRTRQADEADSARRSSTKKPKGRQENDGVGAGRQSPPSTPSSTTPLSSRRSIKKAQRTVIDIRETTQPNTPPNLVSFCATTPPSSPLPVLTPSPSPPRLRNPSYHSYVRGTANDGSGSSSSLSIGASYRGREEVELELIPSSQTQNLGSFHVEEDFRPNISPRKSEYCRPSQSSGYIPSSQPEYYRPSQSSSYIPSSQPDTTHLDLQTDPDCFIASSQSQFMELTPTSPIDPGSELVPSSQTQELCYSQAVNLNPLNKITISPSSGPRSSPFDQYINESQAPPRSSVQQHSPENEATLTKPLDSQSEPDEGGGCTPTISRSQSPLDPPGPCNQGGEQLLSSQPPENPSNDERHSYESLPDAIKDLQDMFGGTYESYPPDFPMSLR